MSSSPQYLLLVKVIIINIQVKQMDRHLEINQGEHNGGESKTATGSCKEVKQLTVTNLNLNMLNWKRDKIK
jgi:hypothetical protein